MQQKAPVKAGGREKKRKKIQSLRKVIKES